MLKHWTTGTVLLSIGAVPCFANAYTISNAFLPVCHEKLASAALRAVRVDFETAGPLPLTRDERALTNDLEFPTDPDMRDLGAVTLLLAIRDNDLKGEGTNDISRLADVHGSPTDQNEHCLRSEDQKEPGGSEAAVGDCRSFIHGRVLEALDGLDATGKPDLAKRTSLKVYLSLREQVDVPLPTYYVRIGQAIHAIQDSFAHTYRTSDGMKITVVLNWLGLVHGNLVESRDGPAHAVQLDVCDATDSLRSRRRELAIEASTAVLRATLDPQKTREQKLTAADEVLNMFLSYSPGCTFDNNWCEASERQLTNSSGCGCRSGTTGKGLGVVVVIWLLVAGSRSRRWRSSLPVVIAGAITLIAASARAESTQSPAPTTEKTAEPPAKNEHAPLPPTTIPVKQPGPRDPSKTAWGAYLGFSGSIDRAAMAGTLGARYKWSNSWTFGLDLEWNPWISLNGFNVRGGVVNMYGTAMLRFPLAYQNFNIRTALSLGASYLLINLYGASAGSLGVYAGATFIALEWKLSRLFFLIINPLNIAVPAPQLRGVPVTYPQYRFSIGLEIYTG